jgi:hypothetical protein
MKIRESKIVTYLAIIHYRIRGQYAPCRHCLVEYQGSTVPRYLWHTCDRCDWGNE